MSDRPQRLRGSGDYATYQGREYFADRLRDRIYLFTNDEPLPAGFSDSSYDWVRGEKLVPMTAVDHLTTVETTCRWRGYEFRVGIISGENADLFYLGKLFDEVSDLPGMERPDKFEVIGRAPVSELTDVHEKATEVVLDHHSEQAKGGGLA